MVQICSYAPPLAIMTTDEIAMAIAQNMNHYPIESNSSNIFDNIRQNPSNHMKLDGSGGRSYLLLKRVYICHFSSDKKNYRGIINKNHMKQISVSLGTNI